MASIQKTGNSYKITVSNGYDVNHKQIRETITFEPEGNLTPKQSKKALDKFVYEFEEQVKNGKYHRGNKITLKAFSELWLKEYAKENLEADTYYGYVQNINFQILPVLGHLKLSEITPLKLQGFYNSLSSEENVRHDGKTGPYAPGTIKKVHGVLSIILSTAVTWQLIDSNPCQKVSPTSRSQLKKIRQNTSGNIKYFTPEQTDLFLDAMNAPFVSTHRSHDRTDDTGKKYHVPDYTQINNTPTQLKIFFILALFGGFRRSELIALTWDDIDFEGNSISITKATIYADHKLITKSTKNDCSTRTVCMSAGIIKVLKHYKAEQNRQRLAIGDQWENGDFLFTQWNGKQMNPATPYHTFKKIIRRYNDSAGKDAPRLPEIPLHGLRHTSATLMIAQKIDVRTVSGRLGHSQTSTTMNIYAHNLKKRDEDAADSFNCFLPNLKINTK